MSGIVSGPKVDTEPRAGLRQRVRQLDEQWQGFEEMLRAESSGRSISVPIIDPEPLEAAAEALAMTPPRSPLNESPRLGHRLGWLRHFTEWRICYGVPVPPRHTPVANPQTDLQAGYLWTSILNCSIEEKTVALPAMMRLRETLARRAA